MPMVSDWLRHHTKACLLNGLGMIPSIIHTGRFSKLESKFKRLHQLFDEPHTFGKYT